MLDRSYTQAEVEKLDAAIDRATGALAATTQPETEEPDKPKPADGWVIGAPGENIIKKWEGCAKLRADGRFDAYPDPGTGGDPWTIGWGSTGPGIKRGVIWTKKECDDRFDDDIVDYVREVAKAIGKAETTQNQFDAMVSFHYNTGAIFKATLTKKHKKGDFAGAEKEFGKWIYAGGRPLKGLKNRRKEEAKLYAKP